MLTNVKADFGKSEAAIESEEAKVFQVEIGQSKQDFERRVAEKDKKIHNSRRNGQT